MSWVDKRAFARACASVNIDVSHTAGALVMGSVSNPRIYSMKSYVYHQGTKRVSRLIWLETWHSGLNKTL